MAKIYEWTYKTETGQIVADNTKDAKRQIAKKFGNAIKIPRGTVIKKIGLAKKGTPVVSESSEEDESDEKVKIPWYEKSDDKKPNGFPASLVTETLEEVPFTHGGYEIKHSYTLKKKSCIRGLISMVYEINGVRSIYAAAEGAEITLPANTKIWRLGGMLNIV